MSLEKIQARDTVGKISSEMLLKEPCSRDPIELERAMHTDYVKNVEECVTTAKKEFLGDFFVVVLTKKEHLMQNVLRHYFLARQSCPTPNYDQTIYHYSRIRDDVNFFVDYSIKGNMYLLY